MAEETFTFYLHDNPGEATPLQSGDRIVFASGECCVVRNGQRLFCEADGKTTQFETESDGEEWGHEVFFVLDLVDHYKLAARLVPSEIGGEKEWVLEPLKR